MIDEVWKDAVGYEDYYQVSSIGNVRSKERILSTKHHYKGKILKPKKSKFGYFVVNLSVNGVVKTVKIHRLVATTFIENTNNYAFVNHKDEDKSNNSIENLEWCTSLYNNTYGTRLKRVSEKNRVSKKCCRVIMLDANYNFVKEFVSQHEAAEYMNCSQGNIYHSINKGWKVKGYYFRRK